MSVNKGRNAIDEHVGSRVRMRRLMLDLTQMQLAEGLGLTFQQVQKYEKGTNRISASRLHSMSHILRVPVPFFFGWRRVTAFAGKSRAGQLAIAGRLTVGSSLNGAMVSSVM